MAKLIKWPKKPKKSSSEAVWLTYVAKVKEVAAKRKLQKDAPKRKIKLAEMADKARRI